MPAEHSELMLFTIFAIVITAVIAVGTLKAASIDERDYRPRTRRHRGEHSRGRHDARVRALHIPPTDTAGAHRDPGRSRPAA